jgi:hypothetical protein
VADPSKRKCQNNKIQHGLNQVCSHLYTIAAYFQPEFRQLLEVKVAKYGVGAFAAQGIEEHDLIGGWYTCCPTALPSDDLYPQNM